MNFTAFVVSSGARGRPRLVLRHVGLGTGLERDTLLGGERLLRSPTTLGTLDNGRALGSLVDESIAAVRELDHVVRERGQSNAALYQIHLTHLDVRPRAAPSAAQPARRGAGRVSGDRMSCTTSISSCSASGPVSRLANCWAPFWSNSACSRSIALRTRDLAHVHGPASTALRRTGDARVRAVGASAGPMDVAATPSPPPRARSHWRGISGDGVVPASPPRGF